MSVAGQMLQAKDDVAGLQRWRARWASHLARMASRSGDWVMMFCPTSIFRVQRPEKTMRPRGGRGRGLELIQEVAQQLALFVGAQFLQRFRLNLANALAGDFEDMADFLQRTRVPVIEAEAELQHVAFARGEGV